MTVVLEQIRDEAAGDAYPRRVLGGESALVLFAAAFGGRQDALWIAEAGMRATCVDVDPHKLGEMVLAYPEGWEYVCADAFEYARHTIRRFDVVSVDCPTNLFDRCAADLPLWCRLARRAVVLGTGAGTRVVPPSGWVVTEHRRRSDFRGGVWWTIVEPEHLAVAA